MKVFNWVHEKFFHTRSDTSHMYKDEKRSAKIEFEKNALLELEDHGVVNTWENGILAIGTLGIGPFGENIQTQHCCDKIIKDLDPEENNGCLVDDHDYLSKNTLLRDELEKEVIIGCKEIEEVVEDVNGIKDGNTERKKDEFEVKPKRRVTLADLFSEDIDDCISKESVEEDDCVNDIAAIEMPGSVKAKKNSSPAAKIGLAKAKKLLKDDLSPVNMFNQLMRSLIKKKIHPEVGGKIGDEEIQMQPTSAGEQIGPHESISFFNSHSKLCGLSRKI